MEENKLLELTSDVVFKSFMMNQSNKIYKARLIHLITGLPEEDLVDASYTSEELAVSNKKDKVMKTDIIVKINKAILSLEMNKEYYKCFIHKNGKYISKINSEQLNSGESYLNDKPIIQINFNDFHYYQGNKLVYEFMMREKDTMELEHELFKSYHIDLSYLQEKCYNEYNELERLCLFFKNYISKYKEEMVGDSIMDEAYNTLEEISCDEKIIGLYDAEKVAESIMKTRLEEAEINGRKEGREQGAKEKSLQIAANGKKLGMSLEDISKLTGLAIEEIERL